MKITKITKKLNKSTNGEITIDVKDYRPGHWINPLNNDWITTRIYVSQREDSDFPDDFLDKLVDRLNKKTLKSNIEILIK